MHITLKRVESLWEKNKNAPWFLNSAKRRVGVFTKIFSDIINLFGSSSDQYNKALKSFYTSCLYNGIFDSSIVVIAKLLIVSKIIDDPELIINGKSIRETIAGETLEEYVRQNIMKKKSKVPEIVPCVIPLAFRVLLDIYDYPSIDEEIINNTYSQNKDSVVGRDPDELAIFKSPRNIFGLLYKKGMELRYPPLIEYDKGINAEVVTDPNLIIQPVCCYKKYLKKSYQSAMIKEGVIIKRCINCGQEIDNESYIALKSMNEGWSKRKVWLLLFSLVLAISLSMFAVLSFGSNNRPFV